MRVRAWPVAAALTLSAVFLGCSEERSGPSAPVSSGVKPVITPSRTSALADGTVGNRVTLTVTGTAPIALATTRGTFVPGGLTTATLATSGASIDLQPCDARITATCAGQAVITATGNDGGQAQIGISFTGFENCTNHVDDNGDALVDCADPQCPALTACGPNGLVCNSGACTGCSAVPSQPSGETSCDDGIDNDCDGSADCADSSCDGKACLIPVTNVPGVCTNGACVCSATEATETSCFDGKDNDCDGVIDCADPNCLGKLCDQATGRVCPGPIPSTCGVCLSRLANEPAALCGDGKDNDCDGKTDCFDPDCQPSTGQGAACNPYGGRCILTFGIPSCGCPSGATTETACSGGVDDDCDGKIDCADEDCQPVASGFPGAACDAFGRTCSDQGACACKSDVEICNNYDGSGNPIDDDCDGRANCADRDCRPATPGGAGQDCSSVDQYGMACDSSGTCACTGNGGSPEATEVTCDDGLDNDCDFLVDCEDASCGGRTCGPAGATCNALTRACVCPGGAAESSCTNGVDDNCNGKTDCEEPSCAAQACSLAFPSYLCISGVCSDPATEYGVAVTTARARIPADGVAQTAVTVLVTHKGVAKANAVVSLTVSDAALGTIDPAAPATIATDSQGRAQATFKSAGGVGTATITATVVGIGASGTATVELPGIGEIRLAQGGILYSAMGVKSSGFQEQNQLVVEVVDTAQNPYPDGLVVTFEHRPLGGSTLSDAVAGTGCAASPCVQTTAATNSGGAASIRLYSGTVAGVVRVAASATVGGLTRRFELPAIPVVGAKPNAGHFALVCSPLNVPALFDTTCHVSLVDAPLTCVALLKDRYNNLLGRSTAVAFMSEAGSVGPPAVTPEYDPTKDPASQGDLGSAVGIISTLGGKLPKDVTPNAGEPSVSGPPDACSITTRNPRDGVVTVVAWTPGEEGFFDANGNGEYDLGEPFVDLPEPFVDYNDDDVREADEPFIDADGNGTFTPANGVWDSNASIWTRTVVVYSGAPASSSGGGFEFESRWMEPVDAPTYPAATPTASFAVRPAFPAEPFQDCNGNGRYEAGLVWEPYVDTTVNPGSYDLGEKFTDCNGNAVRDQATEPFLDYNGNGVYDAMASPATSDTLWVGGCDRNLNQLDASAKYSVTIPQGAQFKAAPTGPAQVPDRLGVGFTYQPCLASVPATCALDCADIAVPGSMICNMRTRVSGFTGGYRSSVTFKGGAENSFDGATQAFWNIEMFGGKLIVPVDGTHQ